MENVVVVTASRDWNDRRLMVTRLMEEPDDTTIIEGGSGDGDMCAKHTGYALGFKVIEIRAEWDKFGRSAGPVRNGKMLDRLPRKVIAFRKSMSRGTSDCIRQAVERGIPVEVIDR